MAGQVLRLLGAGVVLSVGMVSRFDQVSAAEPADAKSVSRKGGLARDAKPNPAVSRRSASKAEGNRAGEVRDDNGLELKLVWCPPGKFVMGDPAESVEVTLTRGFWLGTTEVTQSAWTRTTDTEPWVGKDYTLEGAQYPAASINHQEAIEFYEIFTKREAQEGRLPQGFEYRLPTEAEWEYACRAGTTTTYCFGNDAGRLSDFAWWGGIAGNGNTKSERYAHEVGKKKPNAWGLHDMHGNVYEWCADVYRPKLPGGNDPLATGEGLGAVYRGGSWDITAGYCRSAYRYWVKPEKQSFNVGFRVALAAKPSN